MKMLLQEVTPEENSVKAGKKQGELAKLKYIASDDIFTKNTTTTAGSNALQHFMPKTDAAIIQSLNQAGAQLVGKANMAEFGLIGEQSAIEPLFDEKCPHDAAKAISQDIADFAIVSDAYGQARLSAARSNVIGFKPTQGVVSCNGLIAVVPSMTCVSVIAKDMNLIEKVTNQITAENEILDRPEAPEKLKIGLMREGLEDKDHESILRAVGSFLHDQGHEVKGDRLDSSDIIDSVALILTSAEFALSTACDHRNNDDNLQEDYQTLKDLYSHNRQNFGDAAKRMVVFGSLMQTDRFYQDYFVKAAKARRKINEDLKALFRCYDLLMLPGNHTTSLKIASLGGLPSITLPVKEFSVQLIAGRMSDICLLKAAKLISENYK